MSDTPITDAAAISLHGTRLAPGCRYVEADSMRDIERQLAESRDTVRKMEMAIQHHERQLADAIRERDNAISDWKQADADSIRSLHERNEARKQRDELAGLLEKSIRYIHDPHDAKCIATLKGGKP